MLEKNIHVFFSLSTEKNIQTTTQTEVALDTQGDRKRGSRQKKNGTKDRRTERQKTDRETKTYAHTRNVGL